MLYHELEDGMYSVTSYFFAKVSHILHHQGAAALHNTLLLLLDASVAKKDGTNQDHTVKIIFKKRVSF